MRPKLQTLLLVAMLLFCAGIAVSQEPQSPQSEPQPQASPPNQTAPENPPPQTAEPQTAAPNPATPESSAGKDQTSQEPPPAEAQTPASPSKQTPAAQNKPPSKSRSKSGVGVRKKSAKASPAQAHHATRRHKPVTDPSGKVVVRNGGASDHSIQLSPAGSQQQNSHDRENVDRLLVNAEDNLKRVAGQQLTAAQQSTVDQIRTYMRQAKSAADAGDLARAHTLALKAQLLSVDVSKH